MSFVHNAWYVAALSEEMTEALMSRTILDNPILLYRQENGECAALLDLCPHRFVPLSMGIIKDGNVQCPYHGLEFDGAGRCVLNPHGNGARPASLNVRAFPLVERDGLLWLWPGDPKLADPASIPDYSVRVDPKRKTVGGWCKVDCNYRLLIDNLMDLGHFQYVHRSNAENDAFHKVQRKVIAANGTVQNLMMFPDGSPTVFVKKFMDPGNQNIDSWNDITWHPISSMLNFVGFGITGVAKEQSLNTFGTHIVTPESETTTHYFFGASRNFALADESVDAAYRGWQKQALMMEDKPITEAVEARMAVAQRLKLAPAMLACDEAAVRVAREIDRLQTLEAA